MRGSSFSAGGTLPNTSHARITRGNLFVCAYWRFWSRARPPPRLYSATAGSSQRYKNPRQSSNTPIFGLYVKTRQEGTSRSA